MKTSRDNNLDSYRCSINGRSRSTSPKATGKSLVHDAATAGKTAHLRISTVTKRIEKLLRPTSTSTSTTVRAK